MKAVQVRVRSWRNRNAWQSSCIVWVGELVEGGLRSPKAELVTPNRANAERHAARLSFMNGWDMLETQEITF